MVRMQVEFSCQGHREKRQIAASQTNSSHTLFGIVKPLAKIRDALEVILPRLKLEGPRLTRTGSRTAQLSSYHSACQGAWGKALGGKL